MIDTKKSQPCVYFHFNNSNECFYIGFSRSTRRPNDLRNRSKAWKKHFNVHGLSRVEVQQMPSIELAKKAEMEFIELHTRGNSPLTNKQLSYSGKHNNRYKGLTIGYSAAKNEYVICDGKADILAKGFNPGHVSRAISGKLKTHAGYTWIRTKDKRKINPLRIKRMDPQSMNTLNEWLN